MLSRFGSLRGSSPLIRAAFCPCQCTKLKFSRALGHSGVRQRRFSDTSWSRTRLHRRPEIFFSQRRSLATSAGSEGDEYDLIVIGGGSGGLACAKEAAVLGAKACVLDFVTPTPIGTRWGLGGTCVNVGCIPKKLFHKAALVKDDVADAGAYGWKIPEEVTLDWETLVQNIQHHVKSLNWGHRVQLKDKRVDYINALGSFESPNLVKATPAKGKERLLKAKNVVVAVGGRPNYPEIEGAVEHCITSDDVFSLMESPGKTLVIGASYVALETAGFLHGLGLESTVMIRSIPLRGFDQEMANLVVQNMEAKGVKFLKKCVPARFEKSGNGMVKTTWKDEKGASHSEEFKTVMLAIGRTPATAKLSLDKAGVKFNEKSGKIYGVNGERTNVDHIFAIGDVLEGTPELTPVATKAGRFLAQRLFGNVKGGGPVMDYDCVPTTVFTPLEYGSVGLTEEKALRKFGEDNIEVYHAYYKPLEYYLPEKDASQCFLKIITLKEGPRKVLGMHFVGPNAGEVVQGFGVAMKAGLTKTILEQSVGIHPTVAEEIVKANITKSSGDDPHVTGC